jgi:hypothetical protein
MRALAQLSSRVHFNRRSIVACVFACLSFAAFADIVFGNGQVKNEERNLPAFSSIHCSGSATLRVHKGPRKLVISADSNILPYITTNVSGSELTIGMKPFTTIMKASEMQFDVTLPEFTGIDMSGSGNAIIDAFKGTSFTATISGSGSMKASLDYKDVSYHASGSGSLDATVIASRFKIECSGSGGIKLRGAAERADVHISGSGSIAARDFTVNALDIGSSGSSDVEIKVKESIKADKSGSGSIRYWGNPRIDQHVSGSGSLEKAGD